MDVIQYRSQFVIVYFANLIWCMHLYPPVNIICIKHIGIVGDTTIRDPDDVFIKNFCT